MEYRVNHALRAAPHVVDAAIPNGYVHVLPRYSIIQNITCTLGKRLKEGRFMTLKKHHAKADKTLKKQTKTLKKHHAKLHDQTVLSWAIILYCDFV